MKGWAELMAAVLIGIAVPAGGQVAAPKATRLLSGDPLPSHLSIAINSKFPGSMLLSADRGQSFFSIDSGKTWQASAEASGLSLDDPTVICDPKGNFYRFGIPHPEPTPDLGHPILKMEGIGYQEAKENGKLWKEVKMLTSNVGRPISNPKPGIHFQWNFLYLTWTETKPGDDCESNIYFNASSFDGNRWKDPVKISYRAGTCMDNDSLMISAGPVMSTEGKLYTVWFDRGALYFDRSFDNAKTWLGYDVAIASDRKGWLRDISGAGRVTAQPSLAIDNSASFFRTSLYAVWSDQQYGDGDVWLLRTTSRGDIWSQPIRVNQDDPGKEQFLPSLTVDQLTGILYVVYYDRRAYEDDQHTDLYLSYSVDGAAHFKELKLTGTPLLADPEVLIHSRPAIAAYSGLIAVAWTGVDEAGGGTWVSVLRQKELVTEEEVPKLQQIRKK